MPYGYRTLLEPLPVDLVERYGLSQTTTTDYPTRTQMNVVGSDATIRFAHHWYTAGERLTQNLLVKNMRPRWDVELRQVPVEGKLRQMRWTVFGFPDLQVEEFAAVTAEWVRDTLPAEGGVLNVAGNADLSIETVVEEFLVLVFERLKTV
jgi:hypothetical protein